ncbi:C1 family peptidase [[Mycoplasma] falconis]|uniref:Aminopeptidase n=1 Tax=[Mycoplasma] falconis TaxID=92403 RepID=A0A501XBT8_9BACT|nr:C1 family peptidase [[Mycoplasma] falconis]TPE58088.1 C1 family peptidase [[Mycoplasma] falconis]
MKNIDVELLNKFEKEYNENPSNRIIQDSIFTNGIRKSSTNNKTVQKHNFKFSVEVKNASMQDQKASGRCWIFAAINSIRIKLLKELNIDDIELSQNYVHFYDKLEKANFYLTWIVDHGLEADNEERLFRHFNQEPISDGGYFEYFLNLVEKYGICPKDFMSESANSENTNTMVEQINWRLKAYTALMRETYAKSKDLQAVLNLKEKALSDVYNILVKSLGLPPKSFAFEYNDKDKKFIRLPEMTPIEFYKKYVGETLLDQVDLISDPREKYDFNQVLVSPFSNNVVGGKPLTMLNVTIDDMKKAMIKQLQAGEGVWFGCDVGTFSDSKLGILDPKLFDFDLILTKTPEFSKKARFESRASVLSHAMNMIGVNLDENGNPISWKVENSWGEDTGKKGIFSMSDEWFTEYNFEAIVDKKYLTEENLKGLEKPSIEISIFDPLCEE